ncbi:hypothetical protein DT076_11675 [Desertihabitans brevis]|uniref:Uncharacterized protein n=1 Tax=Desertihabitans brevis TaxID=2268447 RepID=A0A367YUL6_9ACTN|nr:hypothetical protein [Desertihabitans brevis]RCK69518.1 hypothetical protein DT076_11675 [Desertihabitans brevis]
MRWWPRRRGPDRREEASALPPLELGWDLDADARELEQRRASLLMSRLQVLQARRVPLRVLSASPVSGVARLGFADGTALLVRVNRRGDTLATAVLVRRRSVRLCRYWRDVDGPRALLGWDDHRLEVLVTGVDQPD